MCILSHNELRPLIGPVLNPGPHNDVCICVCACDVWMIVCGHVPVTCVFFFNVCSNAAFFGFSRLWQLSEILSTRSRLKRCSSVNSLSLSSGHWVCTNSSSSSSSLLFSVLSTKLLKGHFLQLRLMYCYLLTYCQEAILSEYMLYYL